MEKQRCGKIREIYSRQIHQNLILDDLWGLRERDVEDDVGICFVQLGGDEKSIF